MTCDLARTVLHGYIDGELDAAGAAEFERHVEGCPQCTTALEVEESLRSSIQRAALYERAPATLRRKVLTNTKRSDAPSRLTLLPRWTWLAAAVALLLLAFSLWRLVPGLSDRGQNATIAAQLVDAHIRSLHPGHLTDVVSSDQHTVKPWFDGKLDFSPPVRDFAEQGFPLLGGRLDVLQGRSIAVLIYGRRKHFINLFIWPAKGKIVEAQSGSQQGYNWLRWTDGDFEMWAVSDAGVADLDALRNLFQGQRSE